MRLPELVLPDGSLINPSGKIRTKCSYLGQQFDLSLNRRTTGYYDFTGTLTMLEPKTGEKYRIQHENEETSTILSLALHVRAPRGNELWEDLVKEEIKTAAGKLIIQVVDKNKIDENGKMLWEMTLHEAVVKYLAAAMQKRSKKPSVKEEFGKKLHRFAEELGITRLDRITAADLQRLTHGLSERVKADNLRDLRLFIDVAETEAGCKSNLLPLIDQELNKIKIRKQNEHVKAAVRASNSDVLSNEAEERLNQQIVDGIDHNLCLIALSVIKGTGLSVSQTVNLRLGDIILTKNPYETFIKLQLEFASATQDYTFPAFPFESWLLHEYIQKYYPGDADPTLYLISHNGGKNKVDTEEITKLCRAELQNLTYGYAQRLENYDLRKAGGIEVLRKTYVYRLEHYCGLTELTDEGAWLFMQHRSLSKSVQADHYRSFTSESGSKCLLSYVKQDQRFLPQKKRISRTRSKQAGKTTYTLLPDDDQNEQLFEIELKIDPNLSPDQLIRISAENGLILDILQ